MKSFPLVLMIMNMTHFAFAGSEPGESKKSTSPNTLHKTAATGSAATGAAATGALATSVALEASTVADATAATTAAAIECCTKSNCADYNGKKSTTVSGRTCQNWNKQIPHKHKYPQDKERISHNYCRNPSGHDSAWCYTMDPNKRWENCHIRPCKVCKPGDTMMKDCNKCKCMGGKGWACTKIRCRGKQVCKPGATMMKDCNKCKCMGEKRWACTNMTCRGKQDCIKPYPKSKGWRGICQHREIIGSYRGYCWKQCGQASKFWSWIFSSKKAAKVPGKTHEICAEKYKDQPTRDKCRAGSRFRGA